MKDRLQKRVDVLHGHNPFMATRIEKAMPFMTDSQIKYNIIRLDTILSRWDKM